MTEGRPGLTTIVLGSAAGGGVPQWNCRCHVCAQARAGGSVLARTQMSVAASADGEHWLLVGASPDLRQQILQTPALAPFIGLRHSPIVGVAVISADVDGLAGLLVLRESQPFRLYAPAAIHDVIRANPVFGVLDPALVESVAVTTAEAMDCGYGLSLTLLAVPGQNAALSGRSHRGGAGTGADLCCADRSRRPSASGRAGLRGNHGAGADVAAEDGRGAV